MVPLNVQRHLEALAFLEEFRPRAPWDGVGPLELHRARGESSALAISYIVTGRGHVPDETRGRSGIAGQDVQGGRRAQAEDDADGQRQDHSLVHSTPPRYAGKTALS